MRPAAPGAVFSGLSPGRCAARYFVLRLLKPLRSFPLWGWLCLGLALPAAAQPAPAPLAPYCNLVLEGGGLKGVAYGGALEVLDECQCLFRPGEVEIREVLPSLFWRGVGQYHLHHRIGSCTVTSFVPSGNVASTWMSWIISAMPSIT